MAMATKMKKPLANFSIDCYLIQGSSLKLHLFKRIVFEVLSYTILPDLEHVRL